MFSTPRPRDGAGAGNSRVKQPRKPPDGGKKGGAQTLPTPSTSKTGNNPAGLNLNKTKENNKRKNNNNVTQKPTSHQTTNNTYAPKPENPVSKTKKSNITLRKINSSDVVERKDVYKLLCVNNILINHVYNTPSGFTVKTDSPRSIDQILAEGFASKLKAELKLTPIPPPEYLSQKTVVVKGIDDVLGGNSAEAIKDEILRNNPELKIESVIKFNGMTRIFKIVCKDTATAEKICREGFRAFYYNVNPRQVEQEEHVKINTCFKCYAYNKHNTNQCKSTVKICSECAEPGHTFRECQATAKKCINCLKEGKEAGHRTLAMKCPIRKAMVKRVKEQKAETKRNVGSYAAAAAAPRPAAAAAPRANTEATRASKPTPPPSIILNSDLSVKMMALILEAHVASIANNSKFSEYLSENLKMNYGVDVKFPERDSREIFRVLSNQENQPDEVEPPVLSIPTSTPKPSENNRKRNVSQTGSGTSDKETNNKKQRRQDNTTLSLSQELSSTGLSERSASSRHEETPSGSSEWQRKGNAAVKVPPKSLPKTQLTAPKRSKQSGLKVIMTELPNKNIRGSDVANQVFLNEHSPDMKLMLNRTDFKKEREIIQLLRQNRIQLDNSDIKLVSKNEYKKYKNIHYQ